MELTPMFFSCRSALTIALAIASAPALAEYPAHPTTGAELTAADLSIRDKAVSGDAFEGRGPGSKTGEAAAQWIADELKRVGVKPANHGSYFQNVPAVAIKLDGAASSFAYDTLQGAMSLKFPDDVTYWTPQFAKSEVKVTKSPLVFVGYGVIAPEYHWNDYAGVDVKGKNGDHPDQRSGQRGYQPRSRLLQREGDDLLRPLDIQIRGSGAAGCGCGYHRS
ncbi:MAG: hypothetical protein WDM89_04865 [Rhizomicrobium sp.]